MECWYFETSAVNHLFERFPQDDQFFLFKTKKLQIEKGRKWYISSVVLLEIFKTTKPELRYKIFDFCRCIFYDHLIVSPEEIIINYINPGCPEIEDFYCLNSSDDGLFAREWRESCKNKKFAFQPDEQQLNKRMSELQFWGEYLCKTQKGYELKFNDQETTNHDSNLLDKLERIRLEDLSNQLFNQDCDSEKDKQILAMTVDLALIKICYAITINNDLVEAFWQKLNIDRPLSRMIWLLENRLDLFFRGPLRNISKMMFLQSLGNYSRGSIFDSFQSVYTTYCNWYFTGDKHFMKFKDDNIKDPNMSKIVHVNELKWIRSPFW